MNHQNQRLHKPSLVIVLSLCLIATNHLQAARQSHIPRLTFIPLTQPDTITNKAEHPENENLAMLPVDEQSQDLAAKNKLFADTELMLNDQHTRAISTETTKTPTPEQAQQGVVATYIDNMPFSQGVYDEQSDLFYFLAQAAAADNVKQEALVKVSFDSASKSLIPQAITSPMITLNSIVNTPNPLFGATLDANSKITLAGSVGRSPVIAFENAATNATGKVFAFPPASSALATDKPLADAAGNAIDKVPAALTANRISPNSTIFAAVPQTGQAWGTPAGAADPGADRGITVVQQGGTSLVQLDLAGLGMPSAQKIALDAAPVKIGATASIAIGDTVALCWSDDLQRLFIGLTNTQKTNADVDGGGMSVLVGRLTNNKLSIDPIFKDPATLIQPGDTTRVVGFQEKGAAQNFAASAKKLRSLHSKTNRNYVIVNGQAIDDITNVGQVDSWVHALPLVGTQDITGANVADDMIGLLAQVNFTTPGDLNTPVQNVNFDTFADTIKTAFTIDTTPATINDPDFSFRAAVVGEDPQILGQATTNVVIEDLQAIGNAIYAATRGLDSANTAIKNAVSGVYVSTPIFAPLTQAAAPAKMPAGGHIIGWTRWEPVDGNPDPTYVFGVSRTNTNVRYLSDGTNPRTALKTSLWGTSDDVVSAPTPSRHLTNELAQIFAAQNGIYNLVEFDRQTNGFEKDIAKFPQGQFAMMAALSNNSVALLQTMTGGTSTADFSVANVIAPFAGGDLDAIAPLTTAEVSRSSQANEGYLFIGGLKGLARLANGAGNGWDGAVGLKQVTDINLAAGFNFTHIAPNDITDRVIAIAAVPDAAAGASRMLVLTANYSQACTGTDACKLFKIDLDGVIQNDAAGNPQIATLPFGTDMKRVTIVNATRAPAANAVLGIIATLNGVFVIDANQDLDENDFAQDLILSNAVEVNMDGTANFGLPLRGIPIQLHVVNQNGHMPLVYLLTGDYDQNQSYIYQFDIDLAQAGQAAAAALPEDRRTAARNVFVPRLIDTLPTFRTAFATDGSTFLFADSANFSSSNLLYGKVSDPLTPNNLTPLTSLLNQTNSLRMFAPVKDTTRGTWITTGNNVRVEE